MASVHARKNKAGEVTSWQVKWRLGGGRSAPWQTETFDPGDEGKEFANVFCDAVNEAGQQWPLGWVKGKGYIAEDQPDEADYVFRAWALGCIQNRTGIEERYRDDCVRELETYIFPTFGNCDVRSTEHFCKRTIQVWVNNMAQTYVMRGSVRKLMSPKTLKNLHGLLSSILNEAVEHEPPLRDRNPCKSITLPRTDDSGVEDDDGEDIEFLEPDEVAGIASCMNRPEDTRLVEDLYGIGGRWGEVTALAEKHRTVDRRTGRKKVRIARAWKRNKAKGYYLGTPKTKRSRRTVRISAKTDANITEQCSPTRGANALIYHNGKGGRLPYSTFYDRFQRGVVLAKEKGLLPEHKNPTIHDLRHSHAALLISRGHPLTYVQRRLGHESIQTTSDLYGHLLPETDDDAMATIDGALGGLIVDDDLLDIDGELPSEDQLTARKVYVMHLPDGTVQGWWKRADRDVVAAQWGLDRGRDPETETWTVDWWVRRHGNGEKDVQKEPADRVQLWFMGPAVYTPDGVLADPRGEQHEPVARTVWEWEKGYTEEPAEVRVEWRDGSVETEVEAWGFSGKEVLAAYAKACVMALQVCGLNPALAADGGEDGLESAGMSVGHTDS